MKDLAEEKLKELETQVVEVSFDEMMTKLNGYWLNPDPDAIRTIFASLISFKLEVDPVWIFIVAPPSSLKTEFINALRLIPDIYQLSSLTPQTLVSGLRMKGEKNFSLLSKIGNKILTFKDFGTVLSGRWDDLQKILGQLREVYDGSFVAEFGTGVKVDWRGKMGFISGTTPIIDNKSTLTAILGERFVQYRMRGVDEIGVSNMAMRNTSKDKSIRENVLTLFRGFYNSLSIPDSIDNIKTSDEYFTKLAHLACFVVKARAGTIRDSYSKDLVYIPEPESPARLAKQLSIICRCLAVVDGAKEVSDKQYATTLKIALDCIPRQRMKVFKKLFEFENGQPIEFSTRNISESIGYTTRSTGWFLEDLAAFKLVKCNKEKENENLWSVSQKALNYLSNGLIPVESAGSYTVPIFKWFRSVYQNTTSKYIPISYEVTKKEKIKSKHTTVPINGIHPKNQELTKKPKTRQDKNGNWYDERHFTGDPDFKQLEPLVDKKRGEKKWH